MNNIPVIWKQITKYDNYSVSNTGYIKIIKLVEY